MSTARKIPLSRPGLFILVDDTDYEAVMAAGRWHARRSGHTVYAQRHVRRVDGRETTQQLHRFLTGWQRTDHKNGNGLDNRRSNLRPVNQSQNNANSRARQGTSQFKGVSWRKQQHCWWAQIRFAGKTVHVGYFAIEEEAARAYDGAALALYGEYARPNFRDSVAHPNFLTLKKAHHV